MKFFKEHFPLTLTILLFLNFTSIESSSLLYDYLYLPYFKNKGDYIIFFKDQHIEINNYLMLPNGNVKIDPTDGGVVILPPPYFIIPAAQASETSDSNSSDNTNNLTAQ